MHVLEVKNLIRNYQKSAQKKSGEDIKVLKGLNFAVDEGEFVGIMGKSGCGKTTLLKVLGMIDKRQTERFSSWSRIRQNFMGISWRISAGRRSDLFSRIFT